jgi:Flp pilus assembly protein TadD
VSSRRRRRANWKKKLKRSRDSGSLQVELLGDHLGAAPTEIDPDHDEEAPAARDAEQPAAPARPAFHVAPEVAFDVPAPVGASVGPSHPEETLPTPSFEVTLPPPRLRAAPPSGAPESGALPFDHGAASRHPAGEPLARAKELVQRGRVQEAIELYLGILTVNPSNLKARNNLGVLFDELKQYDAAVEHLEAAERLAPDNVEVLTNLASTLTSAARYERAESVLRRAQKIDPESVEVRLAVGILYFRRGLYAHAEAELRWVCARSRDNGPAFYYRGEALNRLGRYDEASHAMEQARALMPDDPRPYFTLGHLYDRKHQVEEAAEMYREARRLQSR